MNISRLIGYNTFRTSFIQLRFASCWSCGKDIKILVGNLFCSNCNVLQKPEKGLNYFKVLGVKETFDVDENELANRFKQLQKFLHPDKYANKNKEEQEISEKYSSLVNEAYNTLLQPLARGIYMLKLRGKEIPEKTQLDHEFLMKIMEKNEEVERATNETHIMELNSENKDKMKELQRQVSLAFSAGDLKRVTKLLAIMKYYTSIDTQIQNLIRSKGIIR